MRRDTFVSPRHSICRLLMPIVSAFCCSAVYVFHGDPYSFSDPLHSAMHTLHKGHEGLPYHSMVFYPAESGTYPVVFFIGGLNGIAPVEVYTQVMLRIAAHGVIITGVDPDWPALEKQPMLLYQKDTNTRDGILANEQDDKYNDLQKLVATFDWVRKDALVSVKHLMMLKKNLNNELETLTSSNTSVVADWSITGGMCHSAGCESILEMVLEYNSTVNFSAVAWLEPFSQKIPSLPSPVPGSGSLPSLMHGTQWCEMKPNCCVRGLGYISLYDKWHCPRVLINVTDFGHCDILNDLPYDGCVVTHACKTGENNRTLYRDYMQGLVSAFFSSTLQGNWNEMIKYVIQPSLIPVPLGNLTFDISCHGDN